MSAQSKSLVSRWERPSDCGTYVFGRNDLLELSQRELLVVLGQVLPKDLLQVLEVLRRQFRAMPASNAGVINVVLI